MAEEPPLARLSIPEDDPSKYLPRVQQVQWDHYYMSVAQMVRTRANCIHADVGAVLVLDNRIISTGFNGTPAGFTNCHDGGCERCRLKKLGRAGELQDAEAIEFATGPKQLDVCICVHAEANALLSAARCGTRTEGSCLYATSQPCFICLKEAHQAGVKRIVYLEPWHGSDSEVMMRMYYKLAEHLRDNNERNFEQLETQAKAAFGGPFTRREPCLDEAIEALRAARTKDEVPEPTTEAQSVALKPERGGRKTPSASRPPARRSRTTA